MEMLIVVTIIGILASIVLPRIISSAQSSRASAHLQERVAINAQMEAYYFLNSFRPSGMTNAGWTTGSVSYTVYFPDGIPSACNQEAAWEIDFTIGRLDESTHPNHE